MRWPPGTGKPPFLAARYRLAPLVGHGRGRVAIPQPRSPGTLQSAHSARQWAGAAGPGLVTGALVARRYIKSHRPSAVSLLELGCGTGALLAGLAGDMQITGIDLSPEMLRIATRRLPGVRLVEGDISTFSLGEQFDVVVCAFDTINHLLSFDLWIELFNRVHEHLATGGLFIFDVNTSGKLRTLCRSPALVTDFADNVMIMGVEPGADEDISIWDVRIFERCGGNSYRLHREHIAELGVPLARIRAALETNFDLLEEASADGGPVTDESARVFFACRKGAGLGPALPA